MQQVVRVELKKIDKVNSLGFNELYPLAIDITKIKNNTATSWYVKSSEAYKQWQEQKKVNKDIKYSAVLRETLNGKSLQTYLNSRYALKNLAYEDRYSASSRMVCTNILAVYKILNNKFKDIFSNKMSLPTFKTGNIKLANDMYKIIEKPNGFDIMISIYNKAYATEQNISTQYVYHVAKINMYQLNIIERILSKEYKQSEGSIILKKGKIFINIGYTLKATPDKKRNNNITLIAAFGKEKGIYLRVFDKSFNKVLEEKDFPVDNVNRFRQKYVRLRYNKRGNILAQKKGRGIHCMLKNSLPYSIKWKMFQKTFSHKITTSLVRYANQYDAHQILIEDVDGRATYGKRLASYDYFNLYEMLKYKASKENIIIKKVSVEYKDIANADNYDLALMNKIMSSI